MLRLYSIFHCNIAFSSISEEKRSLVVERCYWPLLRLAERSGAKIAIEATGYTLEVIQELDPQWIETLRKLILEKKIEFLGSGYAQIIGPLVPSSVTAKNLEIGKEVYKRLLGITPRIAYLSEQAYSRGMPKLYVQAGFEALVTDWNNPKQLHPEWDNKLQYQVVKAQGIDGTIPILWTSYIAFQKFQRYAHGELSLESYLEYLEKHAQAEGNFALYSNDAEIFDFRPGRFRSEAVLGEDSEWKKIETLYHFLAKDPRFNFVFPSEVLDEAPTDLSELSLETAQQPIVVKKQEKYNPIRWALTGRDNISINTECYKIERALRHGSGSEINQLWKDLCYAWDSDFRTHITRERFAEYKAFLSELLTKTHIPERQESKNEDSMKVREEGGRVYLSHPNLEASLILRRGLAVESLTFPKLHTQPLVRTMPHGYYNDIPLGADYYVGNTNIDIPGHMRITDLEPAKEMRIEHTPQGTTVSAQMETPAGTIRKILTFLPSIPSIKISYNFDLALTTPTSFRTGNVNINPEVFAQDSLWYACHNGGEREMHTLANVEEIDPSPLNVLCSARTALGNTTGLLEMGDARFSLWIRTNMDELAALPMMVYRKTEESYFFRALYSLAEFDDTVAVSRGEPLPKFHFTLEIGAKKLG